MIQQKAEELTEVFAVDLEARTVETPFYNIEWTKEGFIGKLYDKEEERQVLAPGQFGNVLEVYEDKSLNFDAWDIDIYYKEKKETARLAEPVKLVENGPLRAAFRFTYEYRRSKIWQDMIVYADTRRIDFVTHVDWHETNRLLKTAFHVDVHVPKATYDIQFGHVERPTHWNTSWDWAKFEVCAHKWADLSETGYGVSLLNNCKYGYGIKDNVMTLSLLKSAKYPDLHADMGEHDFTYALFPHAGGFIEGKTIEEAARFNLPTDVLANRVAKDAKQLVSVSADAVQIDAVKKAEDEDCLIVRMHECKGSRVTFMVDSEYLVKRLVRCNLLEEDGTVLESNKLKLKPFELCTLKLYL